MHKAFLALWSKQIEQTVLVMEPYFKLATMINKTTKTPRAVALRTTTLIVKRWFSQSVLAKGTPMRCSRTSSTQSFSSTVVKSIRSGHKLIFTSRVAAESNRGACSEEAEEGDICFLAMVSSFNMLKGLVSRNLKYIGKFLKFLLFNFKKI